MATAMYEQINRLFAAHIARGHFRPIPSRPNTFQVIIARGYIERTTHTASPHTFRLTYGDKTVSLGPDTILSDEDESLVLSILVDMTR